MASEFNRWSDPLKSLNVGHGKHVDTKAWKILKFIGEFGQEGASFTEIQHFIWTQIAGNSEESFWEKGKSNYNRKTHTPYFEMPNGENLGPRKTRGYYTTNLYGSNSNYWSGVPTNNVGLLHKYCHKNEGGKWVLDRLPRSGDSMYGPQVQENSNNKFCPESLNEIMNTLKNKNLDI